MHGRKGGDTRKQFWHMWSVPSLTTVSTGDSTCFFFKDGRKISVGDCALFKPHQDSPPFIGIIRCLSSVGESNLSLSVNWLYRPAQVKLATGVALEAAPNEVFYSFQSNDISTASLLHPCKVAFLPKGVELPAGVSSFVCRRVYDIDHKCLWWLTDQEYINGRQKEVNQLLHKTRIEMHATAHRQQGARSPKSANGSATTSPLEHSPDSVQHSSSNLSSLKRGKKRERGEPTSEHIKRDWSIRAEEGDSGQLRTGSNLKLEIEKIAERGGLVDSEMVERLVQLMQLEKSLRKIDLTGRSMLAGIIGATDNVDCLNKFVQLKGLPVLDEWLQEVRRGKIRDRGSSKDGDVSVENFLMVLLHALDKLPVNLNALQMCNIGKSVNHLRSHKNIEIQKKARSLVDTWKKRVEVEMNMNDAKFGSGQSVAWSGGSRHESPHGGNRHSSRFSEPAVKTPVTHSSLKSASVKLAQEDPTSKSASVCPTSVNKDELSTNCVSSELPQAVMEEKCTSSSQSHTNSHCSSGHAKNQMPSVKEDARSSTAGSRSFSKGTRNGSKHRKPGYDSHGTTCGIQRETVPNRGALVTRSSVVEKLSDAMNAVDSSVPDANSHKLIVKIPNRGRVVTQSIVSGVAEDSSCQNSIASCPDQKEKHDAHQCSSIDGLSSSVPHRASYDNGRSPNFLEVVSSPSRNEMKPMKALNSPFSSMNALVESCVKFSEADASLSSGDDVGMNLLASVAAGEITKSATISPSVSPNRELEAAERSFSNQNADKKQLHDEAFPEQSFQPGGIADTDKQNGIVAVTSDHSGTPSKILHQNEEVCSKSVGNVGAKGGAETVNEKSVSKDKRQDQLPVTNQIQGDSLLADDEAKDVSFGDKSEKRVYKDELSRSSSNLDDEKNNVGQEVQNSLTAIPDVLVEDKSDSSDTNEKTAVVSPGTGQESVAGNLNDTKPGKADSRDICDRAGLDHNGSVEEHNTSHILLKQEEPVPLSVGKEQNDGCMDECIENKEAIVYQPDSSANSVNLPAVEQKEPEASLNVAIVYQPDSSANSVNLPAVEQKEPATSLNVKVSNVNAAEEARKDDAESTENTALLPVVEGSDNQVKLGFDLNEGFSMDEGHSAEPAHLGACLFPTAVCSVSSLLLPVSSASNVRSTSVTVAAAAKGPFVPPDDLLRNKTELGWRGSAATSAFRPAEPRRLMETSPSHNKSSLLDALPCKQAKPLLDIDLNVADERILLDVGCQTSGQESMNGNSPMYDLANTTLSRCSVGLNLDLNKADEVVESGQHSTSNGQKFEASTLPGRVAPSIIFSNGEAGSGRDFDLNNGLAAEEMPVEKTFYNPHNCRNVSYHGPFGPRINSSDAGNGFPWHPPGTSYPVSMTPSALPDREVFSVVGTTNGGPQRASNLSFNPNNYRGSMLSSTPTVPFNSTPFQFPVFPFGGSFPLPAPAVSGGSSGFMTPAVGGQISAIPPQLIGTAASVPFQYPHAYVVSHPIPDVRNSVIESNQNRGKQGLDLNSGPGGVDAEGRYESLPTASRPLSAISLQSLGDEQAMVYNMAGGVLKRKEPDGGWNVDKLNFKQSSWQ